MCGRGVVTTAMVEEEVGVCIVWLVERGVGYVEVARRCLLRPTGRVRA
jgi:hypothetical protein